MIDYLYHLVNHSGHWAYVVIFIGAALESSAFLGLIVPGESLVLLGGFLAATDVLDVRDLIVIVSVGAVLGDSIGYELGRHFGRPWLGRYGHWVRISPEHLARVDAFFRRHGGKTVLLGRFIGFLRALVPFVAGSSGMHYGEFLLYNALGGVGWAAVTVFLGYPVGHSWPVAERWLGRAGAVALGAVSLVAVVVWLRRRYRTPPAQ